MDHPFSERQTEAVRSAFARRAGCDLSMFERDELMIVDRPQPPVGRPRVAIVTTFGLGTVVTVEPSYREFVEGLRAEPHDTAAWPPYLGSIVGEAKKRGLEVTAGPVSLLWALSAPPDEPAIPNGLELRHVDRKWMAEEQQSSRFENGVGEPGQSTRTEQNQFGEALFDSDGAPVAVAGVFETLGLQEIGIDVVPSEQGRGLAPIVVAAAVRAVLDEGGAPMYACASTNIRSQRTAIASGFVPVGANAMATRIAPA